MADVGTASRNWENIGSTTSHEYRYVTHLNPSAMNQRTPKSEGAENLDRTGSTMTPSLRRRNAVRLTPLQRIKRFLRRLTWHRRSRSYIFGKTQLQRQPSFVVTPDRSSYSYRFRSRDLLKRKPRPRAWRTSAPVAAWKNSRPMDVLMNDGVVPQSELPQLSSPTHGTTSAPLVTQQDDQSGARPIQQDQDQAVNSPQSVATDSPNPKWIKVSLPLKQDRNSASSGADPNSTEGADTSGSKGDSTYKTPPSGGSGSARSRKTTSAILELPQTPVQRSRAGKASIGNLSFAHASDSTIPTEYEVSVSEPPLIGTASDPQPQSPAAAEPRTVPQSGQATALGSSPSVSSPTSLPSSYRPESWRRSAILTRASAHLVQVEDTEELDEAIEFVGAWGRYLRRAIAVRAVQARERKSWEQRNELRWSQNLDWDSGPEAMSSELESSDSDDYTSTSDSESTRGDSASTGTNSGGSTPTGSRSSSGGSALKALSSLYHEETRNNSSKKSLAPANSPRALAAAARSEEGHRKFSDQLDRAETRFSALFSKDAVTPELIQSLGSSDFKTDAHEPTDGINPSQGDFLSVRGVSRWEPEGAGRSEVSLVSERSSYRDLSDADAPDTENETILESDSEEQALIVTRRRSSPKASEAVEPSDPSIKEGSEAPKGTSEPVATEIYANLPDNGTGDATDDFDFGVRTSSRKRPLPPSPLNTPPTSPARLSSANDEETKALEPSEPASTLLKSRSVYHSRQPSKRVKAWVGSASQEQLLLNRQNTLQSRWGAEYDSDSSNN